MDFFMQKKYIVRLIEPEREQLEQIVRERQGSQQKIRRAQILLKTDADGPCWADRKIAKALNCPHQTIENIRQRFVQRGFEETLEGKRPKKKPPPPKLLDENQKARILATYREPPPSGYTTWSLRLLTRRVLELEIVDSISHETVRQTLKKMSGNPMRNMP
jgi:transposase